MDPKKRQKKESDKGEPDIVFDEDTTAKNHGDDKERAFKKCKENLKLCEKERKEYLEGWQRARADFANARKEEEKRRGEFAVFAKESVLAEIIPVVDSFERAFAEKEAWEKVSPDWRSGVEYIYSQLLSVLTKNGMTQVNPEGEEFDPTFHVSVESVTVGEKDKDGKVVEVVQKGYTFNSKVVRPARVKVGVSEERDKRDNP